MHKRKWLTFIVIVISMSLLFNACAPATTAEPTNEPEPTEEPSEPEPTEEPSEPEPTKEPEPTEEVSEPEDTVVTVSFLEHFSAEWGQEWFDEKMAEFEAENPNIKVERISKPYGELWTSLTAWSQSGDLVDTTQLQTPWMAQMAEWGVLMDMGPIIDEYGDEEFIENVGGASAPSVYGSYNGTTYAVPWGMRVMGLFYNVEFFEEHNLEVPSTWAELEELLRYIRNELDMYGTTTFWDDAAGYAMWSTKQFPWRLVGAGGQMFDEYNQPLFNSPEGKIAMEYWKRLYDDDLISPNAESTTVQQSRGDFCSGKVPMLIGEGPWMGGTCESMGADFTVAMAPGLCGEETCGNNVLVTLLGISVSSEDPEAVFEFIKYLTSDDFTVEFAQEWGSTFMNPAYFELPETQEDPVMGVVPQLLEDPDNFSHWAPIPKGEEMYQRFLEIWQQVLLEDLPVEEALEQMENVAIELTE